MHYTFLPFDESHRHTWDDFVAANPDAWPGQDSAIMDLEASLGHPSFSHLAYDNNGDVAAVVPMFFREENRARFIRFRILCTGSSLRGGPLLKSDYSRRVRQQFMDAWGDWLISQGRPHGVDAIHVALPVVIGQTLCREFHGYFPLLRKGFLERAGLSSLVDLSATQSDILQSFEPECRSMVRRAAKAGVEVDAITERQSWMDCYDLNLETFKEEGVRPYSRSSMETIWDRFVARGMARVFAARYNGQCVSVAVTVGTACSHYYWMGFRHMPLPVPGTSNLLISVMMESLRRDGIRYCEMGSLEFSGDPRMRSISKFKQSFGGTPYCSMQGDLVLSLVKQATADWLVALAGKYRAMKG